MLSEGDISGSLRLDGEGAQNVLALDGRHLFRMVRLRLWWMPAVVPCWIFVIHFFAPFGRLHTMGEARVLMTQLTISEEQTKLRLSSSRFPYVNFQQPGCNLS